jgi:predicted small lipoprotein YifL
MRKRITVLITTLVLLLSLAACATKAPGEPRRVECPNCGYQIEAPSDY